MIPFPFSDVDFSWEFSCDLSSIVLSNAEFDGFPDEQIEFFRLLSLCSSIIGSSWFLGSGIFSVNLIFGSGKMLSKERSLCLFVSGFLAGFFWGFGSLSDDNFSLTLFMIFLSVCSMMIGSFFLGVTALELMRFSFSLIFDSISPTTWSLFCLGYFEIGLVGFVTSLRVSLTAVVCSEVFLRVEELMMAT